MLDWYLLLAPITQAFPFGVPRTVGQYLSGYPILSIVLFAFGLASLAHRRNTALWWFALPLLISNALFTLALSIGDARSSTFGIPVLIVIGLNVLLVAYIFARARQAWIAALFFASSVLSVVLIQGLMSLMGMTGSAI